MENNSDDNSGLDLISGDRTPMSPVKAQLSSKATAFSIAAIIGGEETETNSPAADDRTDEDDTIAPLGKKKYDLQIYIQIFKFYLNIIFRCKIGQYFYLFSFAIFCENKIYISKFNSNYLYFIYVVDIISLTFSKNGPIFSCKNTYL